VISNTKSFYSEFEFEKTAIKLLIGNLKFVEIDAAEIAHCQSEQI
jgi:hypothetical protein